MSAAASNREIVRQQLLADVERTAIDLTANLLRITRGAGRPVHVGPQAVRLVDALQAYYDGVGRWPYDALGETLRLGREADLDEHAAAMRTIVAGALQYAASDLLEQRLHRDAGEREIAQGVDELSELSKARRQEEVAQEEARREASIAAITKRLRRKAKKPPA